MYSKKSNYWGNNFLVQNFTLILYVTLFMFLLLTFGIATFRELPLNTDLLEFSLLQLFQPLNSPFKNLVLYLSLSCVLVQNMIYVKSRILSLNTVRLPTFHVLKSFGDYWNNPLRNILESPSLEAFNMQLKIVC